ncbi:MAG TPA: thioredoxin domain-containing protein [Solirubrobacteraceae bacterium]|jgi:protein-disulfide isomerase|nr:thioredoxin domain-containing protein [Solirubrobacteraceae bacterium]
MSPDDDVEDLTRKQRREQARTDRKAAEQAELAAAARRNRLMQLGVVAAVIIVAIVVIVVATGGKGKSGPGNNKEKTEVTSQVTKLLGGIEQKGNALGKASAPVTVQYFGDLECPFCKEFSTEALPKIIENQVRAGKLRIEYRALETATREPEIFRTQQVAALAAGKQNKMWNYVETFYNEQGEEDSGYVDESFLQKIAEQSGVNLSTWQSDRNNTALIEQVVSDGQAANQAGFTGTPSFSIGRTGGELKKLEYSSFSDPSGIEEAVEKLAS